MIGQGQRWRLLGKDLQVQRTRNWIRRASILTEPREASAEYHGGDHESGRGMLAPNESSQPVQEGFMDRRLTPEPNLSPYRILPDWMEARERTCPRSFSAVHRDHVCS